MLQIGIVGLPNVGKSTLFNALLKKQQAFVANFPFATIEPNVGVVPVPDERLVKLSKIYNSPIIPAAVEFVDIAGLVKGANEGAGLGNKFLSHIREVSVIAHVLRAFTDPNVIREGSSEDPEADYATVQTELILADLQTIQKSLKANKNSPILVRIEEALNSGTPVRDLKLSKEEQKIVRALFLLSAKPEVVVLNVSEEDYSQVNIDAVVEQYSKLLLLPKDKFIVISAKIESELASLSEEEQKSYLKDLGLEKSGLERLIQKAYETLGLTSFLTAGEKEVRAWTIERGTTAVTAAGVIHTDFAKNFIKAEVSSFEDFISSNGWKMARENGKTSFEGRDYIMQDGDVVEFKVGV